MRRRRCDRHFGLGPLSFFEGEGGGAGGNPPAPTPPPTPDPTPPTPPQPPAPTPSEREGFIPRDRFDEVNGELQRLRKAEEERQTKELEAQGKHEQLAQAEKARREEAEAKAARIARRSAFIGAAAGKVADPEAAYKLALADGDLDDLDVDDDGNAKDPKRPAAIVDDIVKRYEFLKPKSNGGRSYGDDRSGTGVPEGVDPSKLSSREMLSIGYAQSRPRQRGN